MQLEATPIYPAFTRPVLLLGAEKNVVAVIAGLSAMLIFQTATLSGIATGLVLWFAGLLIAREMAKADPHMLEVYRRHVRHNAYYPARSTPWRDL